MRKIRTTRVNFLLFLLFSVLILPACADRVSCDTLLDSMKREYEAGNFTKALSMAESIGKKCGKDRSVQAVADSLTQMTERIKLDFRLSEEDVLRRIGSAVGPFTDSDIKRWESNGWLEYRIIDGKKYYFGRTVSNLVLLKRFNEDRNKSGQEEAAGAEMKERLSHTIDVISAAGEKTRPVVPVSMLITYTITVKPDAVPDGELIKCWMPWPKECPPRQKGAELVATSVPSYIISPDSAVHSSIFMEEPAKKGKATVFRAQYRYTSMAQHFPLSSARALPYDKNSELYRRYTAEQLPQINFSQNIRELADSITNGIDDPLQVVEKLYQWFKETIPWTGALEYSTMPDIPAYVCQHRRGDCGMQTLLYMSMLRYKGIPVRWQSGWMVPPGYENLHDWCEIYFEGTGWVPSDVSYDLQASDDVETRTFFMTGLDSYRMIVNSGISGNLYPAKTFMRSEPYDFQRGEVEWSGGNLYFDKWDYSMNIEYLH